MLADASKMLPRLQAEESLRLVDGLLAASQRVMKDNDQRRYLKQLETAAQGPEARKRRAPPITADFARLMGAQIKPGDDAEEVKKA